MAWDFFHLDTVLLRRLHVLVFIHHDSRRVRIAGIRSNPVASWVTQQARNLSMELADRANPVKFLVRDRDTKYTASFEALPALAPPRRWRASADRSSAAIVQVPQSPPEEAALTKGAPSWMSWVDGVLGTHRLTTIERASGSRPDEGAGSGVCPMQPSGRLPYSIAA